MLALAEEALSELGGDWTSVGRIVVGLGPGTFTGIRVGVATARAIAAAGKAEIVGVPTSAALAWAAREAGHSGPIAVVQDARRREYFVTIVPAGDVAAQIESLTPVTCPQVDLPAVLAALDPRLTVAVGDGAIEHRDALQRSGIEVPQTDGLHAVEGVALAAAAALIPSTDPTAIVPVYVREPDAVPTAERR